MLLLIRYTAFFKNRTFSCPAMGFIFVLHMSQNVGYGLSAYFFLMMKHKALGGSSETLSSSLKPPVPSQSRTLWLTARFLSPRPPRSRLEVWARRTLMAELLVTRDERKHQNKTRGTPTAFTKRWWPESSCRASNVGILQSSQLSSCHGQHASQRKAN